MKLVTFNSQTCKVLHSSSRLALSCVLFRLLSSLGSQCITHFQLYRIAFGPCLGSGSQFPILSSSRLNYLEKFCRILGISRQLKPYWSYTCLLCRVQGQAGRRSGGTFLSSFFVVFSKSHRVHPVRFHTPVDLTRTEKVAFCL